MGTPIFCNAGCARAQERCGLPVALVKSRCMARMDPRWDCSSGSMLIPNDPRAKDQKTGKFSKEKLMFMVRKLETVHPFVCIIWYARKYLSISHCHNLSWLNYRKLWQFLSYVVLGLLGDHVCTSILDGSASNGLWLCKIATICRAHLVRWLVIIQLLNFIVILWL